MQVLEDVDEETAVRCRKGWLGAFVLLAAVPACGSAPAPARAVPVAAAPSTPVAPRVPSPPAVAPSWSPVVRPGALPVAERIAAPPVPFTAALRYADGLSVAVRGVEHATITDTGAGAMTGSPRTVLALEFRNAGSTPVELDQVVVAAWYGGERAAPVYSGDTGDVAGTVPAGGTLAARYGFSIPATARGDVTLSVDLDGAHLPGLFRGPLA